MAHDIKLHGWQKDILTAIDKVKELRDTEAYQGLPDFLINKDLAISVSFPRESGHTLFANYLASKFPCVLVYKDLKHYNKLSQPLQIHQNTDTISMFEISFAINQQQPSKDLEDLKQRFTGKKVVVVDNGESIPMGVRKFILDIANIPIVFLGK